MPKIIAPVPASGDVLRPVGEPDSPVLPLGPVFDLSGVGAGLVPAGAALGITGLLAGIASTGSPSEPPSGATPVANLIVASATAINRRQGISFHCNPSLLGPLATAAGLSVYEFQRRAEFYWEYAVGDSAENYDYRYIPSWHHVPPKAGTSPGIYGAHVYRSVGTKQVRVTIHYNGLLWEATLAVEITERAYATADIAAFDPAGDWASVPGSHNAALRFTTWAAALGWLNGKSDVKLWVRSGASAPYTASSVCVLNGGVMIEEYGGDAPAHMDVQMAPQNAFWSVTWDGSTTSWVITNLPASFALFRGNLRLIEGTHYSRSGTTLQLLGGHGTVAGDALQLWTETATKHVFIEQTPAVGAPMDIFQGLPLLLPQADCECLIADVVQASGWNLIGDTLKLDTPVQGQKVVLRAKLGALANIKSMARIFTLNNGSNQIISGISADTGHRAGDLAGFDGRDLSTLCKGGSEFVAIGSVRKDNVTFFNCDLRGFSTVWDLVLNNVTPLNQGVYIADCRARDWSNYAGYLSGWEGNAFLGVDMRQNVFARTRAPGKTRDEPGRAHSTWHGVIRNPGSKREVIDCCTMSSRTSWANNAKDIGLHGAFDPQPTARLATSERELLGYALTRSMMLMGASHASAGPPNDFITVAPTDPIQIVSNYLMVPIFGDKVMGAYGPLASRTNLIHLPAGSEFVRGSPKRVFSTNQGGVHILSDAFRDIAGPTFSESDTIVIEAPGRSNVDLVFANAGQFGSRVMGNTHSLVAPAGAFGARVLVAGDISGDYVTIPVKLLNFTAKLGTVPRVHRSPNGTLDAVVNSAGKAAQALLYDIEAAGEWRNASNVPIDRLANFKDVTTVRFRRLGSAPPWTVGESVWITLEVPQGSTIVYGQPPDDWQEGDSLPVISITPGDAFAVNPVVPVPVAAAEIRNPVIVQAGTWKSVTYREGSADVMPPSTPLDALGRPTTGNAALGSAVAPSPRRDIAGGLRGASPSRGALEPATPLRMTQLLRPPKVTAAWARQFVAGDTVTPDDILLTLVDAGYPPITLADCRKAVGVKRGLSSLRPAASYVVQTDDKISARVEVPNEAGQLLVASAPAQFLTDLILLRNTVGGADIANAGYWSLGRTGGWEGPTHFALRWANHQGWTGTNRRLLSGASSVGNLQVNVNSAGQINIIFGAGATSYTLATPAAGQFISMLVSIFPGEATTMRSWYRLGNGAVIPGPTSTLAVVANQFSGGSTQLFNGTAGRLDVTVDTGLLWAVGGAPTMDDLFDPTTARPTKWPSLQVPGMELAGLLWGASSWNALGNGSAGTDPEFTSNRTGNAMVAV